MASQSNDHFDAHIYRSQVERKTCDSSLPVSGRPEAHSTHQFLRTSAPYCIDRLRHWHKEYLAGRLSDEDCTSIEDHLFECRRCENHWDALSEAVDEAFALRIVDGTDADAACESGGESDSDDAEYAFLKVSRQIAAHE